jgi:hypothetical protein
VPGGLRLIRRLAVDVSFLSYSAAVPVVAMRTTVRGREPRDEVDDLLA